MMDVEDLQVAGAEAKEEAASSDPPSPYSVWWEEPHDQDPENPENWSTKRKWSIITVLSIMTLLT